MVDIRTNEEILVAHPKWHFMRTDRNGTRYFTDYTCDRCGGHGVITGYHYVEGGRCFKCGGCGILDKPEIVKIYTPEYYAKLNENREKRAAKAAAERLEKARIERPAKLMAAGFGHEDDGWFIYRILGDTFTIKDELKALGCKFHGGLGWYAARQLDGYKCQRLAENEVLTDNVFIEWREELPAAPVEQSNSHYVGNVGDRIDIDVVVDRTLESEFSVYPGPWGGRTSYYHIMHDKDGNKFVWKTTTYLREHGEYKLRASIKEHKEYKGEPQTVLTRAKVLE